MRSLEERKELLMTYLAFLFQRAFAALAAIWDRLRGDSAAALASPPFRPPNRPSATAWGFLVGSMGFNWGCAGSNLGAWPVDSSMIWYASWFGSRGRTFFDRSGIRMSRLTNSLRVQTDPLPTSRTCRQVAASDRSAAG